MAALKQIVDTELQSINSTYIVLNQDFCIKEVYQDNLGIFSSKNELLGEPVKKVIKKEYLELVIKIENAKKNKKLSFLKVITKQNNEYEVEILPFENFLLVLIKEKLINTNFMINNLNDKNQELETKYHQVLVGLKDSDLANTEKTDLLLLLCHEFRTPLNIINGYLQILLSNSQQSLTKDQQKYLSKITNASKQLEMIMNDALDFVKVNKGKLRVKTEYIDINDLIEDCIQAQSIEACAKNIKITHQNEESNVLIYSDKKRLTQVLMNILSNAVKYTNEGGYIQINSLRNEQRLLIEVIDTGVGIQAKELAYIFSPYYRSSSTDSMSTGFGIGLFLVKQVLTELGGLVHVSSELGVGSRFIIELPIEN